MLNPDYVPQHLLILACVLRYIMSASQGTILQKQELDALIVQAFAIEITNPNYLQDLQVIPHLFVVLTGLLNAIFL